MGPIRKTVFTLLFALPLAMTGQERVDSELYFRTFPEKLTVRAALLNTSNDLRITNRQTGEGLLLKPNAREYLGISVLFRSVELDFGYSPKFLHENIDNSDSKLLTLNFRMFLGRWMQTIDFYQQQSFSANVHGNKIVLPDFKTLKIGGGTSYIFNPHFSFRAIGFQNEWQTKSAGSFIPRFSFYYSQFDLGSENSEEIVHSYDIAAGPGYFYNFIIDEHFIISAGGNMGAGINVSSDNTRTLNSFLLEANARGSVGYNSESFFAGINTNYLVLEHNEDRRTRLDDEILFFEIYIGFRFDAPKKFMKWADDFNKKFNL